MHYSFQAETFTNVRQLQMRLGCGRTENANGLEFTTNQLLRSRRLHFSSVVVVVVVVVPSNACAQESLKIVYEVS